MKRLSSTFVLVLLAEAFLGLLSLLLETKSEHYPLAGTLSHFIVFFLSLPFNLVDPQYPYYAPETESGFIIALLILTTLLIHTITIYVVYKVVNRPAFK